jgi:hypothetical protein
MKHGFSEFTDVKLASDCNSMLRRIYIIYDYGLD